MARKQKTDTRRTRLSYPDDFKKDAVQLMLDGYTASEVCKRLGIPNTNTLYRWKKEQVASGGPVVGTLDGRVKELEAELRRVERERDILKKALAIFGRNEQPMSMRPLRQSLRKITNPSLKRVGFWRSTGQHSMPGRRRSRRDQRGLMISCLP